MAYASNSVQRHKIADFLDVSGNSTPRFEKLGEGVTALDENPNAQTKSSKYINNASTTKTTTGYETQFSFTSDLIISEIAIKKIYNMGTSQLTGDDCEMDYVRADLFSPSGTYAKTSDTEISNEKTYYEKIGDEYFTVKAPKVSDIDNYYEFTATENTYRARKFPVSIEVSSFNENDGNIQITGNLNQSGAMVEGTFNTSTNTFTANTPA